VEALLEGETDVMVALRGREITPVPLEEVISNTRSVNLDYYKMAQVLAR
jgi:hypothetical protein